MPTPVTSAWLFEHKQLERSLRRASSRQLQLASNVHSSILLLGIISVSQERRTLIRCTWATLLRTMPVRLRFVLGVNASDADAPDALQVPVEERLLAASANRPGTRRSAGATYSSLSSFLKTFHFIKYAAQQPEPLVGLGDDDVFIQPHMLLAQYATFPFPVCCSPFCRASRHPHPASMPSLVLDATFSSRLIYEELLSAGFEARPVVAGAVEWYSWREKTLVATGWERTAELARNKGRAPWRNCSPTGSGWVSEFGPPIETTPFPARRDRCFGPFPFLKGAPSSYKSLW